MSGPRIGSTFSGMGGLDEGVRRAVGGHVVWHCEIEPAACRVLEHHWPDVPNLGDITKVEWDQVPPIDIFTTGFPCQDVSAAGRRVGMRPDSRSGLWTHAARAIAVLRPRLVVIENVRGLLSADADCDLEPDPWGVGDGSRRPLRAAGAVLGDLAGLGYDAQWGVVRAADAGAPHGRARVFITAWPAADAAGSRRGRDEPVDVPIDGTAPVRAGQAEPGRRDSAATAADTGGGELQRRRVGGVLESAAGPGEGEGPQRQRDWDATRDGGAAIADPTGVGRREGWPEPAGLVGRPDAPVGGALAASDTDGAGSQGQGLDGSAGPAAVRDGAPAAAWGDYAPAIRRWEQLLGRPAPAPTQTGARGGQQLSPAFVEFLMGLDEGHVTAVPGLSRNEQLKLLGNGVVPQQAELALRMLLAVEAVAA